MIPATLTLLIAALQLNRTPPAVLQAGGPPVAAAPATTQGTRVTAHLWVDPQKRAVPFEYVEGTILIQAEIAGHHGWMLIDTGASNSVVDSTLAQSAKLAVGPTEGQIYSAGGHLVPRRKVEDVPLVIPSLFSVRMPMISTDLSPLAQIAKRPVIGVIGFDLLSNMLLAVDRKAGTLVLLPGKATMRGPVKAIPLVRAGDRVQIAATIDGKPVRLTLDTGYAAGLSLTADAWARVKRADAQVFVRSSMGASGKVDEVPASRVPQISLGGVEAGDLEVRISPWAPIYGDGVLGMALLASSSFLLDIKNGQLWLIPQASDTSKLRAPEKL
jgi:predicted aspartyl protease